MTTEDMRDCQRTRTHLIKAFIAVLAVLGGTMTKLMIDMAVVKTKVTAIENNMHGHLTPRDNTAARNMKGRDNEERTDLASR